MLVGNEARFFRRWS